MKRRDVLGALTAGTAGLMAMTGETLAAQQSGGHDHGKMMDSCLEACAHCAKVCDETFAHFYNLVSEGKKEHAKAMRLAGDCAAFCGLSACMIARHSPLMANSCQACADSCETTIEALAKFDTEQAKKAVKALKDCQSSCREMVKMMGSHEHHEAAK